VGQKIFVTASVGTAICPFDSNDAATLLVKADAAMYEAKRNGRNTSRQYVQGMSLYSIERLTLETDLRVALELQQFELYYQPILSLASGTIVGVEALIRWNHPVRGLLMPLSFIEIIEETGLIIPVGQWILQEACRQQIAWIREGLEPLRMSVNISAMQFYQSNFSDMVRSAIEESDIQPSHLDLELTESLCMHDVHAVMDTLNALHGFGIKLSIDDFGTGYSNLSYLSRFPVDRLKIDQSFIRNIGNEPVNMDIIRAISALGINMNLEIIAEGVETDEELAFVESNGCGFVQGYKFSKPLRAHELADWIRVYNGNKIILRLFDI
jgi:EAL domain-containing protein (putative c-di-GMP-specific phosphodiesterase class I)